MDWQAEIADCVRYEPDTGKLFWLERSASMFPEPRHALIWNARWPSQEAFFKKDKQGYLKGKFKSRELRAHRVAWVCANGPIPEGCEIDHIDGDKTNNRLSNLRAVSHAENCRNQRARPNKTGYSGVSRCSSGGRFQTSVWVGGVRKHLGCFDTAEEAHKVRKAALLEVGFHPNHGTPPSDMAIETSTQSVEA